MKKLLFASHTDIIPTKNNGPNILGPFQSVKKGRQKAAFLV